MLKLSQNYNKAVQEEMKMDAEQLKTRYVGKQNPKRHLQDLVEKTMADNLTQSLSTCANTLAF